MSINPPNLYTKNKKSTLKIAKNSTQAILSKIF